MYQTTTIILKNKDYELKEFFKNQCELAKLFKNSVIFRCRQLLFAKDNNYINLQQHTLEVLDEFKLTEDKYKQINNKYYLPGCNHFDYMFKITNNADYYNELPMQSTQQIIKECLDDFKSYFKAMKEYNKNPSKFTGKPKLPKYIKNDKISFTITNQDSYIKDGYLKLPKIKARLFVGDICKGKLIELVVKPYYDTFKLCITFEDNKDYNKQLDATRILGLDLGVDNFITTSNDCGLNPFIINGKIMKSYNQWYNKKTAKLKSLLSSNKRHNLYTSNKLNHINKKRQNYFNDKIHKISTYIINYCITNNIGTIVVGKTEGWKTKINIGKSNNQNFTQIPHAKFIDKLEEKATKFGITVIIQEESYTSKCSFLDNDFIYTYNVDDNEPKYSGKRIYRGLYKTKNNIIINADVNGASNIIKKAIPNAFFGITNYDYLTKTVEKINII